MDHRRAAEIIWQAWQDGRVIDALPEGLSPESREAGYAIQEHLEDYSDQPRAGWKIAATSTAGQSHIGVDGPLAGRLLAEKLNSDGAEISISTNRMRVAEPEFAFRFGRDLPARDRQWSVDEILAAVSDLHLTLELPDSRFADFVTAGGPALIADNACARELVVGQAVTEDWRVLDLAAHRVRATVGTRYQRDGIGSNVLGDPREALTWCMNEISALGIDLMAGELITTGTCSVPLEIEPGDMVKADFGILGEISAQIAP